MINKLKPECRSRLPALDLQPTVLRDIIFTLRFGTTSPHSEEYISTSIHNISRLLRISVSEVRDVLSFGLNRNSDESIPVRRKPNHLNDAQIDDITSADCLRAQLKYSINRRVLLIRDMYPGVKLTSYELRKIYKLRGVKQRSLSQTI